MGHPPNGRIQNDRVFIWNLNLEFEFFLCCLIVSNKLPCSLSDFLVLGKRQQIGLHCIFCECQRPT